MTTQDTGLVEAAARAYWGADNNYARFRPDFDDLSEGGKAATMIAISAVLLAILPHLSPESQALLRKELAE